MDKAVHQDILIVGAGMAGLVAALEATANGAQVTVIDKLSRSAVCGDPASTSPYESGNETAMSAGGGLARFSDGEPVKDLLEQHLERGRHRIDPNLIETYLERVAGDCRWLRDEVDLPFDHQFVSGGGPGLWSFLYGVAKKRGVNIFFETKALKILTTDRGETTGVKARTRQKAMDLRAGALILGTGGFEGNQEMLLKYAGPEITYGTVLTGCPTNTGDGHLMALEVGAQLVHLSVCHVRTTDRFSGVGPSRHLKNLYHMGIFVNKDGRRFVDEGVADSDTIANAIALQPGHRAALIFDEKARKRYGEEYETYPRREETIKVAESVEALAEGIDISPDGLKNLIDTFNRAVGEGKAGMLSVPKTDGAVKIDTPPFYGFAPVLPGLNHPLGGLKINGRAQALDLENQPINGLYAAGSAVNWSFGAPFSAGEVRSYEGSYHAGNSSGLAFALVFGRVAGKNAAKKALED